MKIAIDMSPLETGNFLQHRVRGTGFYLENLKRAFLKYLPQNQYTFYTRLENLPKDLDLIHVPYFEPFFLTLPAVNKFNTVVTVHDLTPLVFPKEFPAGIKGKLKWNIQKRRLRKVNNIITDSESSKKDIVKHVGVPEKNVSVVYLAAGEQFRRLGDGKWKEETKKKYELPDHFFLYVGDVTWNKNLPLIITAFKNTNISLVIIGKAVSDENFDRSNPWNKDLSLVKDLLKESENIKTLGFVSTEDLVSLYNLAEAFVMPSLYEGFGLPILEAMACGCPVITSKAGSLGEVAGDAAYFVDPYKVSELENALQLMLKDEALRTKLSEKGQRQVEKFSWKQTVQKTNKVYEKVVKS